MRSNFDLDLSRSFIVQKPFWKILEFWPLFWPEPKNDRNDFEMIFSRAFERRFLFCSTTRRSWDRRGVFKHPPPPPAGRGKSRGPSGRGLTWPGDLTWYDLGTTFLHKMRKRWMNSFEKFGGAARRRFPTICEKPMGGGAHMCPPRPCAGYRGNIMSALTARFLIPKVLLLSASDGEWVLPVDKKGEYTVKGWESLVYWVVW